MDCTKLILCFFFFNDTATTEIYTLSLHDALPISLALRGCSSVSMTTSPLRVLTVTGTISFLRSEEHTSELQSRLHLVCRLLLEKKKNRLQIKVAIASSLPASQTVLVQLWLLGYSR